MAAASLLRQLLRQLLLVGASELEVKVLPLVTLEAQLVERALARQEVLHVHVPAREEEARSRYGIPGGTAGREGVPHRAASIKAERAWRTTSWNFLMRQSPPLARQLAAKVSASSCRTKVSSYFSWVSSPSTAAQACV